MKFLKTLLLSAAAMLGMSGYAAEAPVSWTADNGNGTFTNPLFYDEFSDPDIIRVGDDYYLAGTTRRGSDCRSPRKLFDHRRPCRNPNG